MHDSPKEAAGAAARDRRAERGEATRAKLVRAARELFATRGYADVGTSEVVERAGVTRGALQHHFPRKKDLFRAVYEQAELEIVEAAAELSTEHDPMDLLTAGIRLYLDACTDPGLRQIGLVDGPAVLGWEELREIGARSALGLVSFSLRNGMDAGVLRRADVESLAHLLLGALGEAGMLVANADDPRAAREQVEGSLLALLEGLRA
jgi:AcrR family transcriptional regulator